MLSRRGAFWLLVPVLAILLGYVVYPSLRMFATGMTWDNYAALFSSWRSANVRALYTSVWISLTTVVGAGVLGTTLAYLFFRFDFPLRRTLMALAALPLALPPLVGVLAFLFLYGESGILPRSLQALLGLDAVPFRFEGLWAVWLVHVYSLYVYFYLFVMAALRGVDRSLLEAAADLGAPPHLTFRRVVLPLLRPALVSAALLVFMVSMASFTAPLLFAGTDNFLTLQIYNYKTNGNLALSAAVSTVLTLICLAFLLLIELGPRRPGTGAAKGSSPPPVPVRSGWARALALGGALALLLFLLLPIATIVLLSFAQEGSWTYQILPARYTLANYVDLLADPDVFQPIRNSLRMAALATAANVVFGVAAALFITRGRLPGRTLVRLLTALPFAIPGTVIAVNLIVTFNTPSPLSFGRILVGTFWILPLAYFIRHIPFVVRATVAALEGYDDRLSEASADLGAGFLTTFRRVVLPVIGPGILAGTLLTFVAALGEFVSSIMLYIFENRPISVEILAQLRLYDFGAAAAYAVFLMLLIGLSTLVVHRLGARDAAGAL
ncbi:MAG: iron ABC transporter permease [Rhodothermaceae bacterium]|nr:MAG: iron ABC transporter permease [Rhodothermaceae bacterium]